MPSHMAQEAVRYYLANRQPDTPWVPLPVINFDAFFGSGTFSKKWLKPMGGDNHCSGCDRLRPEPIPPAG